MNEQADITRPWDSGDKDWARVEHLDPLPHVHAYGHRTVETLEVVCATCGKLQAPHALHVRDLFDVIDLHAAALCKPCKLITRIHLRFGRDTYQIDTEDAGWLAYRFTRKRSVWRKLCDFLGITKRN